MLRLTRVLAVGLVAATTAAGSVAWAGSSVPTAQHEHVGRGFAVHRAERRCDAMQHRFDMRRAAAEHRSLSPRQQRMERNRFLRAQHRVEHLCDRIAQRATGHRLKQPRSATAAFPDRRSKAQTAAGL